MEKIENGEKILLNTRKIESMQPQSIKPKKKKKKVKKKKEKKCAGLKELLEEINEEKKKKHQESQKQSSPNKNEFKKKDLIKDYINNNINKSSSSSSSTTVGTLSPEDLNEFQKLNFVKNSKIENFEIKQNYLMKNIDLSIDEKLEEEKKLCNKRKLFSPICEYYDGCDKNIREVIKGSIDMTNSKNFLKKEDFITYIYNVNNNNCCNNDLNDYINPEISNNIIINNNINKKNYNNILINSDNIIDNKNENEQIEIDINMSNGECDYMNIPGEQFMDYYYCQIPENNLISKFTLLNNIYFENYLKFQENKKRQNDENNKNENNDNQNNKKEKILQMREGDWLCNYCYNLNFSFRVFCNRCKAPKPQI